MRNPRLRLPLIVLSLSTTLLLSACGSNSSPQARLQKAQQYEKAGKERAALVEIRSVVKKHPKNMPARVALGTLLLKLGDPGSAEAQLEQAKQLGASPADIELPLAQALNQIGKFKQTLELVHPDKAAAPRLKAELLTAKGEAELGLQKPQAASTSFDDALATDPHLARAVADRGMLALTQNKPSLALEYAEKALALDKRSALAWMVKGDAQSQQHQLEKGAKSLQQALAIGSPGLAPIQLFYGRGRLAQAQIALGQHEDALKNLNIMLAQAPKHPYPNYLRGLLAYEQKDYATAAQHLQTALNANSYDVRALTLLGAAEAAQGQDVLAMSHLTGALAQDPNNVMARRLLASLQLRAGQDEDAIQTITANAPPGIASNRILSLFPSAADAVKALTPLQKSAFGGTTDDAVRLALAQALLIDNRQGNALSVLGRIKTKGDTELNTQRLQAAAYLRGHAPAKALAIARDIVARHPNNVSALELGAMIFAAANANNLAEDALRKAEHVAPNNPVISNDLGGLMLRERRLDAAAKEFQATLGKDPKDLTALISMARIAAEKKQAPQAVNWLRRAHTENPSALAPLIILTRYYLAQKEPAKALDTAQQAASLAPNAPPVLTLLAQTQFESDQKEQGLKTLKTAARAAPGDPRYGLAVASAQEMLKQASAAQATLEQLVAKHPGYVPAVRALAFTQLRAKDPAKAFATADALAKQPNALAEADALKGDLYALQKNYASALDAYTKGFAATPSRALALRIYGVREQMHSGEASQSLVAWLKDHSDDIVVRSTLASYYQNQGDDRQAEAQYRLALKTQPNNPAILNNVAWLASRRGDPDALTLAEKAHRLAPNSPQIADTLGWILIARKHPEQALPLLQKASEIDPGNPVIHYHYAVALARTGHAKQAVEVLKATLGKKQRFPEEQEAKTLLQHLSAG